MNRQECPECGSLDTDRQGASRWTDTIEEIRTCHDCITQFTVTFEAVEKTTDYTENA